MKHIRLGVVCLARDTFDTEAANGLYRSILKNLATLEKVTVCAVDKLVITIEEAAAAAEKLYSDNVDGLAIISGTFHLGHLALIIKEKVDKPVLLWGLDELPYNGGKIRLNSVCGVNLNASNLVKSGHTDFVYTIGSDIDKDWLNAVRIIAALKGCRLGMLGARAHGFFNVAADEPALFKHFGCLIDHYELRELMDYNVDKALTDEYNKKLRSSFDTAALTEEKIAKVALLAAKFRKFFDDKGLSALSVRCWPEFASSFGISPCAAMSILQSEGYILACEGDIDCAVTMEAHSAAGAETPFMADLSQIDLKKGFALMWHCGVAPCNLKDGICSPTLDMYFAGGKGVTAGFAMKAGEVSLARFDCINGAYRLFKAKGSAVQTDKLLTGTFAKVIFDEQLKDVLDRVVYNGVAHHVSMVYGDYSGAIATAARLLKIKEV